MGSGALIAIIAMLIALVLCAGGIWALMKQKIVVDENGEMTAIDIPLLGKLKTNYPSLIVVFIGAGLAVFVVNKATIEADTVTVQADLVVPQELNGRHLFVGAIPARYFVPQVLNSADGTEQVEINVEKPGPYSVIAFVVSSTPDGRTRYVLTQGQARQDRASGHLKFTGAFDPT